MDDPKEIDDHSCYASNEYPDLDLVPNYLWVGKADELPYRNIDISTNEPVSQLGEVMSDGHTKDGSEDGNHSGVSDSTASEDNEKNPWCQSPGDFDPDFEMPDDCST